MTGAAGRIGSYFAEHSHEKYDLRLMVCGDEEKIVDIEKFGEVRQCDLADLDGLNELCEGIDSVLHLAADHRIFAPWEELLPHNIVGCYHLFEAAKTQGCRRVIYASSVNAMNGSGFRNQVRSEDPINPGNLYGVSKCFGEALCRLYATQHEVSGIALRIGAFQHPEVIRQHRSNFWTSVWVSPRDLQQLITCCIDDETLQFAIFNGLSNNRINGFDISDARQLVGYHPVDDAFAEEPS